MIIHPDQLDEQRSKVSFQCLWFYVEYSPPNWNNVGNEEIGVLLLPWLTQCIFKFCFSYAFHQFSSFHSFCLFERSFTITVRHDQSELWLDRQTDNVLHLSNFHSSNQANCFLVSNDGRENKRSRRWEQNTAKTSNHLTSHLTYTPSSHTYSAPHPFCFT